MDKDRTSILKDWGAAVLCRPAVTVRDVATSLAPLQWGMGSQNGGPKGQVLVRWV